MKFLIRRKPSLWCLQNPEGVNILLHYYYYIILFLLFQKKSIIIIIITIAFVISIFDILPTFCCGTKQLIVEMEINW